MSVLNRSMFQRPMPVVRRMAGTPKTGETIVQEEVIQKPKGKLNFLEKLFDGGTGLGVGPYADSEQGDIIDLTEYGAGTYDRKNPQFIEFIETRYMDNKKDYTSEEFQEGIDSYVNFLKSSQSVDRAEGSPMQGEQVNAENVGIMDGFSGEGQGEEAEAMAILEEGQRAEKEIEGTETYDELMRSIRGDDLSEADRREELASYVGEKDAEETPDSVLTLVQPVMQMLDQDTANTGIGQIEEGQEMATIAPTQQDAEEMMAMNMTQQPVGVANGGYMSGFPNQNMGAQSLTASDNIDNRIMQNLQFERMAPGMMGYANGGQVQPIQHFNTGKLATSYKEDYLPLYMELMNDPERKKGNTLMDISQASLAVGRGDVDPSEALSMFLKNTQKRGDQDQALKTQLSSGALSAAVAADTAAKTAGAKSTNTFIKTGNAKKDKITAALLGMTITEFNSAYPISGTTFEFSANGSLNKFNEPKDKKEQSVYIGTIGQEDTAVFADLNLNLEGIAENTLVYKKPDGEYEFSTPKAKTKVEYVVSYPIDGIPKTIIIDISTEDGIKTYNEFLRKYTNASETDLEIWNFEELGKQSFETNITNVQPQAKGGLIKKRNVGTPLEGENSDGIEIAKNDTFETIEWDKIEEVDKDPEVQTVQVPEGSSNANIIVQKANLGERTLKQLDELYEIALNYPQYFGFFGRMAGVGKSTYLTADQVLQNVIGLDLPEFKYVESPVIDKIATLQESISGRLANIEKEGTFRSVTTQEKRDKAGVLNVYDGNAIRTMDSIKQLREILIEDINSFYKMTGNKSKEFKKPAFYNLKPRDIKGEDMKLEIIKSSLPKEMLDIIDTDPQIMNAITAIMNGKDPELVIKKYKEWKASQ